ncbi:MAG: DUF3467 domain-containing protein [Candidatus Kariarchaeaceae archaeon]|jgi:hypothetical protein
MSDKRIEIEGLNQSAKLAQEFQISHTPNEFLLNLIEVIPQMGFKVREQPGKEPGSIRKSAQLEHTGMLQKVVGRFVMSPAAMKKLVNVMNHNLKQYEEKFGEIAINPPEGFA